MNGTKSARTREFLGTIDRIMLPAALAAIFTIIIEWGWSGTLGAVATTVILILNALVIALFIFESLAKALLAPSVVRHVRENTFEVSITVIFILFLAAGKAIHGHPPVNEVMMSLGLDLGGFYLITGQVYLVLSVLMKTITYQKHLTSAGIRPAAVVIGSFVAVILVGTALLSSPQAVAREKLAAEGRPSAVDALFTATSAVCVTGLVVKDTGGYFSPFGQGVILVLIQIGGLGLMTFVTFSSLIIGRGIALREQVAMRDVLSYDMLSKLPRLIVYILLLTVVAEAIGALCLYSVWEGDLSTRRRVYLSVFHAVSAFCNAGFSLFPNSFGDYRGSIVLNTVVTGLVIVGGLGFIVNSNIATRLWGALRARWRTNDFIVKEVGANRPRTFLTLQTKIVLVTTASLLVAAAVLFAALEWRGALAGLSLKEKVLSIWFQSVTPRTAGFNTLDYSLMRTPTYLIMGLLMFIGASPGSTGGGIKTSTFAILLATVYSSLKKRPRVETMRRQVPRETVRQAIIVVFLGMALVIGGLFVLSISEGDVPFERLFFEEVSAFGTVGLSTGTPESSLSLSASLSWVGKLVIIITMFAGRIGPLTLVIAIAQKRYTVNYEYPSEQVVIG